MRDLEVTYRRLGVIYDDVALSLGLDKRWDQRAPSSRRAGVLMVDLLHHYRDVYQANPSADLLAEVTVKTAQALGYYPADSQPDADSMRGHIAFAGRLIAEVTA